MLKRYRCSDHAKGIGLIRVASDKSDGSSPSRKAVTISGAINVNRMIRPTYDGSTSNLLASSLIDATSPLSNRFCQRCARASATTSGFWYVVRSGATGGNPSGVMISFRPPRRLNFSGMWIRMLWPSRWRVIFSSCSSIGADPFFAVAQFVDERVQAVRPHDHFRADLTHDHALDQQAHDARLLGRE